MCCLYLTSCITLDGQRPSDGTKITEPFIPDPPQLNDFVSLYGERDGGRLYVQELKEYSDYMNIYIAHLSVKYMIEVEDIDHCLKPPVSEGIYLPYAPRLSDNDPIRIVHELTSYIEEISGRVKDYNESIVKLNEEYQKCIN